MRGKPSFVDPASIKLYVAIPTFTTEGYQNVNIMCGSSEVHGSSSFSSVLSCMVDDARANKHPKTPVPVRRYSKHINTVFIVKWHGRTSGCQRLSYYSAISCFEQTPRHQFDLFYYAHRLRWTCTVVPN